LFTDSSYQQVDKIMKNSALLFILLVSFSGCAENTTATNTSKQTWSLKDSTGTTHDFPASEKGKTTVVLFWATWCPYCKRLMPHLQSSIYQYGNELNLQVFALNINEDGDAKEYIEENGYDFILFEEAEAVAQIYNVKGTPGLLVFDKKGELIFDLRKVQQLDMANLEDNPNWQKAIKLGPFWGSELRKTLETLK
jgi:cytochrome c biogenesis protein CcmG/thiol:disulfide interchange protein DsbE